MKIISDEQSLRAVADAESQMLAIIESLQDITGINVFAIDHDSMSHPMSNNVVTGVRILQAPEVIAQVEG